MEQKQYDSFMATVPFECMMQADPITSSEAYAAKEAAGEVWRFATEEDIRIILGQVTASRKVVWIADTTKRFHGPTPPLALFDPVSQTKQYSITGTKHHLLLIKVHQTRVVECTPDPELRLKLERLAAAA
jgi:hypothetical protein